MVWTGVASLTWWRVPTLALWKTAVITGEFGHFLAVVPLLTGAVAWWDGGPWSKGILLLSGVGVLALLRPVVQAAWISRGLPTKLAAAFGPVNMAQTPFSLSRLIAPGDPPVVVETYTITGGLELDIYRAEGRAGPAPCVVMIHGGSWEAGAGTSYPT